VVDLIVLVPQLDSIPLWKPRIGISGRLTCPGLTEIERSSYYDKMVCGHLLNTVRQTLAVAPGISGVTVAVVRFAEPRFCGTSVECLLAADVTRDRLADINWETAFAPEIFCQTSSNLRIRRAPGTQELQLIDLSDEPDILALLEELDQAPGSDASAALRSTATDRDGIRALLEESDQTPDSSDSKGPTSSATPIPLPSGGDAPRAAAVAGEAEQLGLMVGASSGWWKLPPLKLLKRGKEQNLDRKAIEEQGRVLERALAGHDVETHLVGYTVGPAVTRFELELGVGVKVAQVTKLAKDVAYAMASPDVRILAPIPGRSAIGVEVPNRDRQLVTLGSVLQSIEAQRSTHPLEVALGRDIAGRPVMVNLAEMPHLLIAGAAGSGKSSCINSVITSILMRATPDEVRLILVDPKRVELGHYNGLPHLLTQVVVNPERAANSLHWAVTEMERRYDLLAECGMRDITGYNAAVDRGELDDAPAEFIVAGVASGERYVRLPYVLIVVDELHDLMMVAARDVEESICRIAQMARAVGIHLVIATRRPSAEMNTGVIKENIPSRLAFSVSSLADSRAILDQPGAERLMGRGDLLLLTDSSSIPRRIQGPWVGEDEVQAVVDHWRQQSGPRYVDGVEGEEAFESRGRGVEDDDDEYLPRAMELVVRSQLGSASMLQRKLGVGFARAVRLIDLLERRGIVGPSEGSKPRAVLMSAQELDEL
jgi:S-DNA-T family DNA segregation ATPase FtsK/SpoIIIE